jgi:hypothetical protein
MVRNAHIRSLFISQDLRATGQLPPSVPLKSQEVSHTGMLPDKRIVDNRRVDPWWMRQHVEDKNSAHAMYAQLPNRNNRFRSGTYLA